MNPKQYGIMAIPAGPKRRVTLMGGGLDCLAMTLRIFSDLT